MAAAIIGASSGLGVTIAAIITDFIAGLIGGIIARNMIKKPLVIKIKLFLPKKTKAKYTI